MYNKVKTAMSSEGYNLLTPKSEFTTKSKLEYECPNGHIHSILNYSIFLHQKRRCPICVRHKHKTPYNVIYKLFSDIGARIIYPTEQEYDKFKTKTEKIEYECINGHLHSIRLGMFKKTGSTCPECFKLRVRMDYDIIVKDFHSKGYKITYPAKDEYDAAYKQKIEYECPNGHRHSIRYSDFKNGHGCPECAGLLKHEYDNVKKSFMDEGYRLISTEYKNSKTNLEYECPNGHKHSIRYNDWSNGVRCGVCDKSKTSIQENEVAEFIKSLGFDILENDRSVIGPLELDIVIPDKKIAIEYCGLYWHTESQGKNSSYHLNKLNLCQERGYRLITLLEDEWVFKKDIVKSRIKHILGIYDDIIYARKCKIQPITTQDARAFIETYHIQGYTSCGIKLGIFHDIYLVGVMTFATGSISKGSKNTEGVYELSRFCTSCKVIGGAGKLLKYFQRNYKYKELFTYADLRWSDGNLYDSIGFRYLYNSKPNYWYVKNEQKRYHRFNFRKNVLKDKLDTFDPNKTEYENMLLNGYNRIWDCGNMKYSITSIV